MHVQEVVRRPQTWQDSFTSGWVGTTACVFAESDELLPLASSTQPLMADFKRLGRNGGASLQDVPEPQRNHESKRISVHLGCVCPIRGGFDRRDSRRCNRQGDASGVAR